MQSVRKTQKVFEGVSHELVHPSLAPEEVSSLQFSSRDVTEGALFFCVPGTVVDGHDYAADAVDRGAAAIVAERELDLPVAQYLVEDARAALALCSANFFDDPSSKLAVVGITGTNGKTTTGFLVEHLVVSMGQKAGLIGTVECHIGDEVVPSEHTTPESRDFQALLAEMADASVDVCACEVSSHALVLDRVLGTSFEVAAFSNLTQDHLDYHKTMEEYFDAKALLFTKYQPKTCVINVETEPGERMAKLAVEAGSSVISVGSDPKCEVCLLDVDLSAHATIMDLEVEGQWLHVNLPLAGRFNVDNAMLAFGIGLGLGYPIDRIVEALEDAPQVPGRLERVIGTDGTVPTFGVLVDYAHTPDSVEKAISAARAITKGRVICVFGCGGDRDHGKRPKMGAAALAADFAVVTSDNPRSEDPAAIIEDILEGMKGHEERYAVIPDRREAIAHAIGLAQEGDTVLIAGKGHEDYQIIGTEKLHFDDREEAAKAIEEIGA